MNRIVHTIHRKPINPANQPAFRPYKQVEYEWSPKGTSFRGLGSFLPRVYKGRFQNNNNVTKTCYVKYAIA